MSIKTRIEVLHPEQSESSNPLLAGNDGYMLDSERVGNFEWWYFDCVDIQNNCMLKIVAHLGTDPFRLRFFPTLALSIKTPEATRAIEVKYQIKDFFAHKKYCDVSLGEDCHIYSDPDHPEIYHIDIHISEFRASLIFRQADPLWDPPSYKIKAVKGNRQSEFFWKVLQTRSVVSGSFELNSVTYVLKDAIGYHDHNYWQLNSTKGLFIEDLITRWYWGKCVIGPYTAIFTEIRMAGERVNLIIILEDGKLVYSTDKDLTISANKEILFSPLKSKYPSQINILGTHKEFPFKLVLNCEELIETKDLLKGVNPFLSWLVKSFLARPAYFGIKSTVTLETPERKLAGFGNYECMLFRDH